MPPKKFYHVTEPKNVDSILRKGLSPRRTPSGDVKAVYLWSQHQKARTEDFCVDVVDPRQENGGCAVLEVRLPEEIPAERRRCIAELPGYRCEYLVKRKILPKYIKLLGYYEIESYPGMTTSRFVRVT